MSIFLSSYFENIIPNLLDIVPLYGHNGPIYISDCLCLDVSEKLFFSFSQLYTIKEHLFSFVVTFNIGKQVDTL